jgi:hypothetical protein
VEHYSHTEGLSSDSVWTLFEDREGIVWATTPNGLDSFRDPAVTTFSALEGLSKDAAVGFWLGKTGRSGLLTTGRSIASPTEQFPPFERVLVFQVIKSAPCLKIAPEICGREWMMDSTSLRMGTSAAYPNPVTVAGICNWPCRRRRGKYLGGVLRQAAKTCADS